MSAKINYVNRRQPGRAEAGAASEANCACDCGVKCPGGSCPRCVNFCETMTLHESFDASGIEPDCARIAYDVSFLGYTVDELTMDATLPCGGTCPVDVYRVSLTGAIPYIISVGTVTSGCGSAVDLSVEGSTMVDEMVGYVCGGSEPDLSELCCCDVTPEIVVSTEQCGCSDKTNVKVCGTFTFDLPSL